MDIKELLGFLKCGKVEFRELGEITIQNAFKQLGASELERIKTNNGNIRLLPSSNNNNWYSNEELCKNYICDGEIITLGRARYANLKYHKGKFVSSNNIIIQAKNDILCKYLYYFIATHTKKFYVETPTYPKFDNQIFQKTQIPVPPLEIQQKIVEILDAFTELQAELQAELHARRKQYEYYRNALLSFESLEKRAKAIGGGA